MIKKKIIKICVCLFAVIIAGGFYSFSGRGEAPIMLSTGAVFQPYRMTDGYKSGKYYKNLTSLSLSGDEARDVLAIAMSQVGYHEGDSNADMHGESAVGTHDFVEYNVLAGKYDNGQGNGLSYGYYWCASFVNWCLRMAGVSENASGSEVSCLRWYSDCKDLGIFKSKSGYIPSSGDIIFFRDEGSTVSSTHVGLVRYSDGQYVYTVEGNTSNGSEYSSNGEYVALKKHSLSSKYIVGYATPKYNKNTTAKTVDYSGKFLSLGDYIAESDIAVYSDSALSAPSDSNIPAFSVFAVTEISEGAFKIKYDGAEGYISTDSVSVQLTTFENIYKINYVSEDGNILFLPQYRREGEQRYVYSNSPERYGSGFVEWVMQSNPNFKFASGDKLPTDNTDVTLVAVWDGNYYTVSFKDSDGKETAAFSGYYGTEYKIPEPPPAPDGFVFSGWDAEPDGVIRGDAVYTASYISQAELESVAVVTETQSAQSESTGCAAAFSGMAVISVAALLCPMILIGKKKTK